MSWARVVGARVRGLFRRGRLERDLDDEVRFHLDMQIEENLRSGMSPAEARHAALRSFGGVEPMKEQYRHRSSFALLETVAQDIRYALRSLRRSPAFTLASIATLAVAIGANTAMFSVLNAVVLRPLPYHAPERLAMLWTEDPAQGLREGRSAYWNYDQWRSRSSSFTALAVFDPVTATLTGAGRADLAGVVRVSPGFFPLLGVQPVLGRVFTEDEALERRRLAVISHRFWQTRFNGAPGALGADIELDGLASRIIGILPADFQFARLEADIWEPHTLFPDWEARRGVRASDSWFVIGRLRPGVTFEQAQEEMRAIARRLDEQLPPADRNRGVTVVPLSLHFVGLKSRLALWMLSAAVLCVLLIAAANVASLSLARSVGRAREVATRAALGASPARIARQLLAESVTLSALSAAVGLLLALAGIRFIRAFAPPDLPRLNEVGLDARVLGWAIAIAVLGGILAGLAPALSMCRLNVPFFAGEGGRTMAGGISASRIRRALVVAEFALAIVLLAGAGLLVRSWRHVENIDPGFRPERVLSMQVRTPLGMAPAQRVNFYNRVLEEIESLPGVVRAGFLSDLFINIRAERALTVEGDARAAPVRLQFRSDEASPGCFQALGARLLSGRYFTFADGPGAPRVAIINQAMARSLWRGRDPAGGRFKIGSPDSAGPWFTVVGVIADMRRQGLERDPVPQLFVPLAQEPSTGGSLLIRTSLDDPLKLAGTVEAAVRRVEKRAVLHGTTTLERRLGAFLAPRRSQTWLVAAFAAIALLLAAIGIYGLIQYSVAARTQEIGIRIAVGAQSSHVFRMVIGEGLKLSLAGLAFGLLGAVWVAHAGRGLLYGVSAADPVTFAAVSGLLTAVAASACYLPARRATKIEPVKALRQG
jgi:putative ABC transport system permease protein